MKYLWKISYSHIKKDGENLLLKYQDALTQVQNINKLELSLDDLFSFIVAYEKCKWEDVDKLIKKLGWDENHVIDVYLKANSWCNELLDETFMILE